MCRRVEVHADHEGTANAGTAIQAAFVEQGKQLAESVQKVFLLETQIKENAHKVDRLRDYEKQIDQLIKLQQLWYVKTCADSWPQI